MIKTPSVDEQIRICLKYLTSMRTFWAPFTNAHYYCGSKNYVSYDRHLLRNCTTPSKTYSIEEHFSDPSSSILLGSSAAMGCFSSSDQTTLSSRIAYLTKSACFNLGGPGTTILQNALMLSSLYRKYFKKNQSGPKRVIFYGFYNELSVVTSPRNHFYVPALDYVNYDLRMPLHLVGYASKFTTYLAKILRSTDFKTSFFAAQEEYTEQMTSLSMYDFDSEISPLQSLFNESEASVAVESYSHEDLDRLGILLHCNDIFEKVFKTQNLRLDEIFAKLDPIIFPALSILSQLSLEYGIELEFYVQPNIFSVSNILRKNNGELNPLNVTIANQILKRTPVKNLSNQASNAAIQSALFPSLVDTIRENVFKVCPQASFHDLNNNKQILTNACTRVRKPFFCDQVHLTDFGFDTVAHAIFNSSNQVAK